MILNFSLSRKENEKNICSDLNGQEDEFKFRNSGEVHHN